MQYMKYTFFSLAILCSICSYTDTPNTNLNKLCIDASPQTVNVFTEMLKNCNNTCESHDVLPCIRNNILEIINEAFKSPEVTAMLQNPEFMQIAAVGLSKLILDINSEIKNLETNEDAVHEEIEQLKALQDELKRTVTSLLNKQ